MNSETKTIVLIHGLWMTPRSWHRFRACYEERGYRVFTPAWPRLKGEVEEIRRDHSALAGLGLLEIVNEYEKFIHALEEPPIIIGHSVGGLITQMLLDRRLGAAGVSIDGAVPKGIFGLPLALIKERNPALSNPFNYERNVVLTFEQFRRLFAQNMTMKDAAAAFENYIIPGPGRPIFEAAFADLNPWAATKINYRNSHRAPLLIVAGGEDRLVPPVLNRINHKLYKRSTAITDYKEFSYRSHLIMAQRGWREVAEYILAWAQTAIRRAVPAKYPSRCAAGLPQNSWAAAASTPQV
jgi:pimeloyl-ACP methyl ester carboxylesterase